MDESERMQRWKDNCFMEMADKKEDDTFADRIAALLNHPQIDKYCMVDAYYYDFSAIPRDVQERFQIWRDCYLIFGITTVGEMITKWVDRWDLDSDEPVVNGEVIHHQKLSNEEFAILQPIIQQSLNPKLLSAPVPDFFKMFEKRPTKL